MKLLPRFVWLMLLGAGAVLHGADASFAAGTQPQLALDPQGKLLLTWSDAGAIRFAASTDDGRTFSPPGTVATPANLKAGRRRGPRIAGDGRVVLVAACTRELQAWASTDGGATWRGPVRINDVAEASREGLHALAALPGGGFMAVWLDLRNGRMEIWGARSADGANWSANQRIYRSPGGAVCECCHPSIAAAGRAVHVMWRNTLEGARDLYVASSNDGGGTFGPARKLGSGTWKLSACPMDGGGARGDTRRPAARSVVPGTNDLRRARCHG